MNIGDTVFWIAKGEATGVILAGIMSDARGVRCTWTIELTPHGWEPVPHTDPCPLEPVRAFEAVADLVWRCHEAGLHHASVDSEPWPDAPKPWRLEMTLAALESGHPG